MFKISFYVPESHLEEVKTALFNKGAGKIGPYDCCCWQTKGTGQYRPLADAKPYQGNIDEVEQCTEYLVELVCHDNIVKEVVAELLHCHPYETPAYSVWKILQFESL
jgi:structural toxin protein (hemagglutinin/hemolysin) RtxA